MMKRMKICVAILGVLLSFNTNMLPVHAAHVHDESCYAVVGGHSHSGSAENGGGCYSVPVYHVHTGSAETGGGCYSVPVYHVHTGSAETGGGCYSVPVYHVHEGNAASGGGCYGNAHTGSYTCTLNSYLMNTATYPCSCGGTCTDYHYGVTHSSCGASEGYHRVTCSKCSKDVIYGGTYYASGSTHTYGSYIAYDLICGKTETTIEAYELGCNQGDATIVGYQCGCGKTETTIEGYRLGCGLAESEGVRTLICTIPETAQPETPVAEPVVTPVLEETEVEKTEETASKPVKTPKPDTTPKPVKVPEEIQEETEETEVAESIYEEPEVTIEPTQEPEVMETSAEESLVEVLEEDTPAVAFSQVAVVAAGTSTATGGMVWIVFFWFFRKCKVIDSQSGNTAGICYIGKKNNSYTVNVSKRIQNKCGQQITIQFDNRFVKKYEEEDIYILVGDYRYKKVIRETIELDIQEE